MRTVNFSWNIGGVKWYVDGEEIKVDESNKVTKAVKVEDDMSNEEIKAAYINWVYQVSGEDISGYKVENMYQ